MTKRPHPGAGILPEDDDRSPSDVAARLSAELEARAALARLEEDRALMAVQMREANEQLVLTTLHAQRLAEEANVARAAAESARNKLEETELELRAANRRKDEFLAMLGHELRNPLAPILTALELMKLRSNDSSLRERDVIERQVRHMVALIDDLLDVSRITSGTIELHRVPVELSVIVAKAVETASPLLESRRHVFTTSVAATGLRVNGDPTRLAQVFANLLTNAAKYTEPGGRISLEARREHEWIRVSVTDDGAGIPDELLQVIFERFVQGTRTLERARGGLGLGLAIVKSLVGLHGGDVSAHSAGPGTGSEFVVRLPALERGREEAVHSVRLRSRPGRGERSARRILVVDDNVDGAEMLAEALRAGDREVAIAYDGPEALRLASSFQPDAVVLDIGLPVMDGYEVARILREREREKPAEWPLRLIALTGYGQDVDRQQSANAGMDVHLVKPVDFDALEAALVR